MRIAWAALLVGCAASAPKNGGDTDIPVFDTAASATPSTPSTPSTPASSGSGSTWSDLPSPAADHTFLLVPGEALTREFHIEDFWRSEPIGPLGIVPVSDIVDLDGDGGGDFVVGPEIYAVADLGPTLAPWAACETAMSTPIPDIDDDGLPELVGYELSRDGRALVLHRSSSVVRGELASDDASARWSLPDDRPLEALLSPGDLDGDGIGDVVATSTFDEPTALIWSSADLLAPAPPATAELGHAPQAADSFPLGDVDGDGLADLWLAGFASGASLASGSVPAPGPRPGRDHALGDLDGDGCPELLSDLVDDVQLVDACALARGEAGIRASLGATSPDGWVQVGAGLLGDLTGDGVREVILVEDGDDATGRPMTLTVLSGGALLSGADRTSAQLGGFRSMSPMQGRQFTFRWLDERDSLLIVVWGSAPWRW